MQRTADLERRSASRDRLLGASDRDTRALEQVDQRLRRHPFRADQPRDPQRQMRDRIGERHTRDAAHPHRALHELTTAQAQLLRDLGARRHIGALEQLYRGLVAHLPVVFDHALDAGPKPRTRPIGRDARASPLTEHDQAASGQFIQRSPGRDPRDRERALDLALARKRPARRESLLEDVFAQHRKDLVIEGLGGGGIGAKALQPHGRCRGLGSQRLRGTALAHPERPSAGLRRCVRRSSR